MNNKTLLTILFFMFGQSFVQSCKNDSEPAIKRIEIAYHTHLDDSTTWYQLAEDSTGFIIEQKGIAQLMKIPKDRQRWFEPIGPAGRISDPESTYVIYTPLKTKVNSDLTEKFGESPGQMLGDVYTRRFGPFIDDMFSTGEIVWDFRFENKATSIPAHNPTISYLFNRAALTTPQKRFDSAIFKLNPDKKYDFFVSAEGDYVENVRSDSASIKQSITGFGINRVRQVIVAGRTYVIFGLKEPAKYIYSKDGTPPFTLYSVDNKGIITLLSQESQYLYNVPDEGIIVGRLLERSYRGTYPQSLYDKELQEMNNKRMLPIIQKNSSF